MNTPLILLLGMLATAGITPVVPTSTAPPTMSETIAPATVYDFTVKSIDGKDVKLSQYKGKKLLIVNTASKCGFTPQYAELEELSKKYAGQVVVLGFPSDSFNQELGSNAEVAAFCQKNFGVTFPLFSTVPVKGADAAPLYKFLADKARNGAVGEAPTWNFCKYLVDERGHVVAFYPSAVKPMSDELTAAITH